MSDPADQEPAAPVTPDSGLLALGLLAKLHQLPAEPDQLRHDLGRLDRTADARDLLRAAKLIGLSVRLSRTSFDRLGKTPLPAIAEGKDGTFVLVARVAEDKVLLHDPISNKPIQTTRDVFEERWTGRLILSTRRAGLGGLAGKFDVTWFIPAIVRYRRLIGEVMLAAFFLNLFALATPLLFQIIIDKVLAYEGLTTLHVISIAFIAVAFFESVLGGLRTYLFSHTTNRIDVELGAKLFRHVLGLPMAYFNARRVGDTVARVRELDRIRDFLTSSALTLVIDLFFAFVFVAVMFFYAPTLTWIVLALIPLFIALSVIITPIFRRRLDEKFKRAADNQAFLTETVTGVETVKAMAVEPQFRNRWDEQLAAYVKASFRADQLGNVSNQIAQFISKATTAATLWWGAQMVIDGSLSVGQMVAFNMLSARLMQPILKLVQLWQDFQQARISVERLGDVLNVPAEPGYNPNRATPPALKGAVSFEGVTFRYRPDGPEILRRISLDVKPGEVIGFVGPSGSGKSTLTKLIQRLHAPESGRVLVDGIDLALVDPAWLRRQIGVVLQENNLFNRSVRENIALSDPAASMERVVAAAELAGAHEFISGLPEAYDAVVGERGSTLSGGQRQRIAIARALLLQPRILIFDEATSALDVESEAIIRKNMRQICQGRTVFVIAHRLSAVRDADRIVGIDKGEIVEEGTHGQLLQRGGLYKKLWDIQTGGFQDEAAE